MMMTVCIMSDDLIIFSGSFRQKQHNPSTYKRFVNDKTFLHRRISPNKFNVH